jgi:hypothetical protein
LAIAHRADPAAQREIPLDHLALATSGAAWGLLFRTRRVHRIRSNLRADAQQAFSL